MSICTQINEEQNTAARVSPGYRSKRGSCIVGNMITRTLRDCCIKQCVRICKGQNEKYERIYQSEQTLEMRNMTTIVPSGKKIRVHKAFRNVKQLSSVVILIDKL